MPSFNQTSSPNAPGLWDQRVGAMSRLPRLLRGLGVDPDTVLAHAGLAANALDDPEMRIDYGALGRLFDAAAEATGNPQFGLLAGGVWHIGDLGLMGEMVRNSPTVGEALRLMATYQQLNSGGGVTFAVKRAAVVDLGYAIYYPLITGADQIYDCVLAIGYATMQELAGPTWVPTEVFLPHAKPRDALAYRSLFKVTPRFNAEFAALRFPAHWLDRPVRDADPLRRAAALARGRLAQPDLRKMVYLGLRKLLLHGKCSGDDLAHMLAMHRRTLNRRLSEHGTTFQQVLDDVRFEVARQLLSYSNLALDDIAACLGYSGISSFMRTFRRWTGATPSQWRRHGASLSLERRDAAGHAAWQVPSPTLPRAGTRRHPAAHGTIGPPIVAQL